jgi:hypothetical protein
MCLSLGEKLAGVRDAAPQSQADEGWRSMSRRAKAITRPLSPPAVPV